MDTEQKSPRQRAVSAALTLAWLAAALWMMTPQHTRQLWAMRSSAAASRTLNSAARRAGRAGMAAELRAGKPVSEHYQLPYLLSCGRDACARAYERFRAGS